MQQVTSPPEDETQESTPELDHPGQHGRLFPKESSHRGLICLCGSGFTRSDALNRHIKSNSKDAPKYRCPRPGCKNRHPGRNGFHRKDNLLQHLTGYHNEDQEFTDRLFPTCPHPGCDKYREPSFHLLPRQEQIKIKPFGNRTQYNKHMRSVHRESPFSCRVLGCSTSLSNAKALVTHLNSEHPSLQRFLSWSMDDPRELCPFPDCETLFPPLDGQAHMQRVHSANY